MKHIIVQVESILKYPPTISLMRILKDLGDDVILLTSEVNKKVETFCDEIGVELLNVGYSYSMSNKSIVKLIKIPFINRSIKKKINDNYDENSLIWIMTSISLKYIGNALSGRKYVMYMYELSQEIRFHPSFSFPKVKLNKLFKEAKVVIECEYNRSFIAQAWFDLPKLPYVIPNKPYFKGCQDICEKKQYIQDEKCANLIEKLKDKKIVLYQGVIDKERPLEQFARALEKMGGDYAFVVMSGNGDMLKYKGKNTYLLPFVTPPHHLEITSWAYIGILIYVPVRGATTSPLNAVYCAPNKIYEYSMYGIPMIGNNIPGLKSTIDENNIGSLFEINDEESIIKAIKKVEADYSSYCKKSADFYKKTDNYNIIQKIVKN